MSSESEIRPFRIGMPEEAVADLRRRIAATRWPERETMADDSQGVRLGLMQDLAGSRKPASGLSEESAAGTPTVAGRGSRRSS